MDQERNEVRQVEDARQRVADDVRSVAENANVVERAKENVRGRISDAKDSVADKVSGVRDNVRDNVSNVADTVRNNVGNMNPLENPLAMLIGGIAVGFLIGMLLPVTRFESERIGPITDDMKDRVRQARDEVVRRGGEVIKETIDASKEAAMSSLREQAGEMGMGEGDSSSSDY